MKASLAVIIISCRQKDHRYVALVTPGFCNEGGMEASQSVFPHHMVPCCLQVELIIKWTLAVSLVSLLWYYNDNQGAIVPAAISWECFC